MNTTRTANEDPRFYSVQDRFALFSRRRKLRSQGLKNPRRSLWRDITPFPFLLTKKVGAAEHCTATSDMFTWHINQTPPPPQKNAIWNKSTTGRGTRRPQIHEIFCLIISTARPVFLYYYFFFLLVQSYDWSVSAVQGFVVLAAAGRGGKSAEECLQYTFEANLDI